MNNQKPESKIVSDGKVLSVHSIFRSIQGEGPFVGRPAVFVRLAGCNLKCPYCDTDYTSDRKPMLAKDIAIDVYDISEANDLVVITGGEPFRQNLDVLVESLAKEFDIQIETNGTLAISKFVAENATIVCSPKTPTLNKRALPRIDAFKYVLEADRISLYDGLPTSVLGYRELPARPTKGRQVFLQPMDHGEGADNQAQTSRNMEMAVKACMEHGHTLGLQIHKLIGVA